MSALSERKIDIVRTLVESIPDTVVGRLHKALAGASGDPVLGGVLKLVESEARDRQVRNLVLKVVLPLFEADSRSIDRPTFPAAALPLLWRGLKASQPQIVAEVNELLERIIERAHPGEMMDTLTAAAAAGLAEARSREFQAVTELCEQARPGSTRVLVNCLELSPLTRHTIGKLAGWISHTDDDTAAAARVAYADACAVSPDAGLWFFEMLAAQLPQPWMALRLVCSVMDRPSERYLAESELAVFGERVMADVDRGLAELAAFDPDSDIAAAKQAGRAVALATRQMGEMEADIDLSRECGWGARLHKQRLGLASAVEARLRAAEAAVDAALPTQVIKVSKARLQTPHMIAPPDPKAVNRAIVLLTFADEVRTSASYGGFGAARVKMIEKLDEMLEQYVAHALEQLRTGEAKDPLLVKAFMEVAADIMALVRDPKSADIVRRRATTAVNAEIAALAASGAP
jgi:hypothetical protein